MRSFFHVVAFELVALCALGGAARAQAPAATPASSPATSAAATPVATSAPHAAHVAWRDKTAASGGGAGTVWVNTPTKVYHCAGTSYYGKTKTGKYLTEADAKAEGDRPAFGRGCAK